MTEDEMHLMSFVSYVSYTARQPVALKAFRDATGDAYSLPETPLDRLIGAATGADRDFVRRFVDWCAGHYGRDFLPSDFLDRIVPPVEAMA